MTMAVRRRALLLAALAAAPWPARAQASPGRDAAPMREAALALLRDAGESLRGRLLAAPFDAPARTRWSYLPGPRTGLALGDMPGPLHARGEALLRQALSAGGLVKVQGVIALAQAQQPRYGGPQAPLHAFAFFGEPAARGAWGWRLEGHHLSVNVTVLDDRVVSATPLFLGADPMDTDPGGHGGLPPLHRERYMGRDLARSLTPAQLLQAGQEAAVPADVLAGPGRDAPAAKGIACAQLGDETQRHLILGLAQTFFDNLPQAAARAQLARLDGPARDGLRFVWHGGLGADAVCYWRLQGETVLIEYATRRRADHVHTLWREPGNDFGRAALAGAGRG